MPSCIEKLTSERQRAFRSLLVQVGTGQMSAVETGQMSAAEAGQMSAVEAGQMQCPVAVRRVGAVWTLGGEGGLPSPKHCISGPRGRTTGGGRGDQLEKGQRAREPYPTPGDP